MNVASWFENNEALDKFCGSPFWNTTLTWNTYDPDFTKCFEKTFLVWIPCAFIWIFSPLEIHFQKDSKNRDIPWNWKNSAKILINALICVICLSDFIYSAGADTLKRADIFMPLCKLVTFGLAFITAYRNKTYGIQSSGILFLFWLLCAICGVPQFRTEIRSAQNVIAEDYYQYLSYLIYYPLTVAMLLLNCFGEGRPRIYPYGKTEKPSPEPDSSFPSRITYSYFDRMMYKGWRNPLEMKDMWDLKPEDRAKAVSPVFQDRFARRLQKSLKKYEVRKVEDKISFKSGSKTAETDKAEKRRDTSVVPVLWSGVWPQLLMGVCLRLIFDLVQFLNPKILGLIINYAGSNEPIWKGLLYAIMMFLVNALMTLVSNEQMNIFFAVGLRIKTVLTSAIYRKALTISNAARKDKTAGEIVNLMAVDAPKFQELMNFVNTLWSAPFSILLSIYFLWQELGPSAITGVVVMILLIPLNTIIVNKTKALQVKQMKDKDERVKMMNEILSGMKVLKLYAWEKSFEQQIMKIRNREVSTLRKAAYLGAVTHFIWNCAPFLVSCLTFAMYVFIDENNVLTPAKAFVSLSLMNLLRMPMVMLPIVVTNAAQVLVSVKRINSFLNAEDLVPYVNHDNSTAKPIVIQNGTFTWGEEPTLKNINIQVQKNNLTAVVGTVGAGKSSLISAILGEMDKINGTVNTLGSIAYVPQQAWIQNATVQDNITFGNQFNKNRYNRVIEACALKSDFEMLADGDQTEIGEKGINLSGGQKQRISLARAVYVDADVYLLDDPLSAVDSHVGKHIFDKLLGPSGLLRNKTRVLVTHAVTYLPQTHSIIVLKEGNVTETGSYQELLGKKGAFAEFLLQHITEEIDEDELDELQEQLGDTPIAAEVKRTISRQRSRISESEQVGSQNGLNWFARTGSMDSLRSSTSLSRRKFSVASRKMSLVKLAVKRDKDGLIDDKEHDKGKLIEVEKEEKGNVKMDVYGYYLVAVGTICISFTLLLNVASQGLSISSNLWLGRWSEDPNMIVDGILDTGLRDMYLGVYGSLGVLQCLASLVMNIIFAIGTMKAAEKLHNIVLTNVMRLPMSFFDTTPSGRILSRFSGDIIGVDYALPMVFKIFFSTGISVIGTLIVICYTTPLFTAVIVPVFVLYMFIQRFYVTTSRQLKRIESVSRTPIYSHFGETVSGTTVIRAYGQADRFINESEEKIDSNQKTVYATNSSVRWLSMRLEMIGNLLILAAALLAVLGTGLDPALVGLSVSYALNITGNLNYFVRMISDVETTIVAVERIKEYGEKTQEAAWEIPNKKPVITWPETGTVEFKKYAVRYRAGLDLVLKGISFHVKGGEKVGIVGRTGAGKSSLTLSLFRIIESAQGEIEIDGRNIAELGLHDLRSRLTIIPQDAVLFSGNLRLNLDPFDKHSDEEVWKVLELAHLKDYVKALPAGLNHKVSEGGENLSVGQRQLICLARALLRKTKILILDEATAAVDLETDDLIQKTIRTAFADCTVLTIAHRLNTIIDSDRVLVLDKGQIAEFDIPTTLLEKKDSIFFGMCKDAGLAS